MNDRELFQDLDELTLPAVGRDDAMLLGNRREADGATLGEKVVGERRGDRHTIFFGRLVANPALHRSVEVEEHPDVRHRLRVELFDHQAPGMRSRPPVDVAHRIARLIFAHARDVRRRLMPAGATPIAAQQVAGREHQAV